MKKKLVALLLTMTLCVSGAAPAGAASFSDSAADAAEAEMFGDGEGISAQMPSLEDTENPEAEEVSEAPQLPSGDGQEALAGDGGESQTDPEEEDIAVFEDGEADQDLFNAGEDGTEVLPSEIPEPEELSEEELLAAQAVLDEGSVLMAHWRKSEDGRWKLIKSVEEPEADAPDGNLEESGDPGLETDSAASESEAPAEELSAGIIQEDIQEAGVCEEPAPTAEEMPSLEEPAAQELPSPEETNSQGEELSEEVPPAADAPLAKAAVTTYYGAEDGIVHIKTLQSVSNLTLVTEGDYLFDKDGYMVTGRINVAANTPGTKYTAAKEHFFMDEDHAKLLSGKNIAFTPYNSNLGQMQKAYWLWTGTAFRYYSSNGGFLSMDELKEINEKAGKYTGYYKISGKFYCLKSSGVPVQGFWDITDVKKPGSYYFLTAAESGNKIPGAMLRSGWRSRTVDGKTQWRYYRKDGRHRDSGVVACKLDTSKMGNYLYLLDAEGTLLTNAMAQSTKDKAWYFSNAKGRVYKNKIVKYDGARYYVNAKGKLVSWKNSWHRIESASNRYYYFGSTPGKIEEKSGWQRIIKSNGSSAGWFYFPANGNHYVSKLTKEGRYFGQWGNLASGVWTVNGKTYFFQSSTADTPKGVMYKKTWIHSKNKWYFAGADGVLYKNIWANIGSDWYYFKDNCTVLTNATATKGGVKGYLDSRGRFCTGWVVVSNASNLVKYVDPATGTFAVNKSLVIDGLTYWFDSNGYRMNDVTSKVSGPYYVEVDRVNGVMTVFNAARTIPVKSIRVSVGLPGTSTPTGRYTLTPYSRWQALMGPSWGQYGTHVNGAGYGGIFVHSIACTYANSYNLPAAEYNKLGSPASHGCIRCCVADAKWVFEHCNGAKIYIFDGTYKADEVFKGPLGRRPLTPLRGSKNFDPTDPAVA